MPVLFAMTGWSTQWHQPSAWFVGALRPYLSEAEPASQGLLSKLRQTNLERKKLEPMSWMQRDSGPVRASFGQQIV